MIITRDVIQKKKAKWKNITWRPRIYLAGPIMGCDGDLSKAWRKQLAARLRGFDVIDPTKWGGGDEETSDIVVRNDKRAIASCDIMIAYCWKPSVGTSMEILYAFEHALYIIVVGCGTVVNSPWIRAHAPVILEEGQYDWMQEVVENINEWTDIVDTSISKNQARVHRDALMAGVQPFA
jgi:nucleoside 2-deoxyribosyltransferase